MREPTLEELGRLARGVLGPEDGDAVARLSLPALRLEGAEPIGRSRLGGRPVMEADQPWPQWAGRPLSFLVLLDLEDIAGLGIDLRLPPRGLVNFFYDVEEQPWGYDPQHAWGWRIVLADPAVAEERDRPDRAVEFDQRPLGPRRVPTLPHPHELPMREIFERHEDRLWDLHDQWQELASIERPDHQIGGWPCLVQNPLQTECQLASNGIYCGGPEAYRDPRHEEIRRGATDWRLLLQVDTDDTAEWVWGDFGSLYYCIKGNTVDAATLDAAWMVLQCG